jgi:hypothetical protein
VAQALDEGGRKANRAALVAFLSRAMAYGLIAGGDLATRRPLLHNFWRCSGRSVDKRADAPC